MVFKTYKQSNLSFSTIVFFQCTKFDLYSTISCCDIIGKFQSCAVFLFPGSDILNYTGAVYIYYGNGTSGGVNNRADVIILGDQRYYNLGTRITGADVNMDGYKDLIIGSKYAPMSGEQRGSVIVFFSKRRDYKIQLKYFANLADWSLQGEQNYSWFGHDFVFHNKTSVGPVLVVSAPGYRYYTYFFFNFLI